jgi:hypothetical protein
VELEVWQIVLFAFVTLLPFALMVDFWPHRERMDSWGRPIERSWERQIQHPAPGEDDHH